MRAAPELLLQATVPAEEPLRLAAGFRQRVERVVSEETDLPRWPETAARRDLLTMAEGAGPGTYLRYQPLRVTLEVMVE